MCSTQPAVKLAIDDTNSIPTSTPHIRQQVGLPVSHWPSPGLPCQRLPPGVKTLTVASCILPTLQSARCHRHETASATEISLSAALTCGHPPANALADWCQFSLLQATFKDSLV